MNNKYVFSIISNIITVEQMKVILDACNNILDNMSYEESFSDRHDGNFSLYISSLIVKFVSLYGCSNSTINQLKLQDYEPEENSIIINDYKCSLPPKLSKQMNAYYTKLLLFNNTHLNNNDRLFVDIKNPDRKIQNSKMSFVLKKLFGSCELRNVAKFAIIEMASYGVNKEIIKSFTGYKDVVVDSCVEYIGNGMRNDAFLHYFETVEDIY